MAEIIKKFVLPAKGKDPLEHHIKMANYHRALGKKYLLGSKGRNDKVAGKASELHYGLYLRHDKAMKGIGNSMPGSFKAKN